MSFAYPEPKLYIDGEWTAGSSGITRPVFDPATEEEIGRLPVAGAADLDKAVMAASRALPGWRSTPPLKRCDILMKAAALLRERIEEIAWLTTREQGQPIGDSKVHILRGIEIIEWDAQEGRRLYGRIIPSEPGLRQMVVREPVGVVAAFAPWNAPVFTPCRKIASALAAGCTLVLKPAEETPASTLALVQTFIDAGVPPGVLNVVFGDPAAISEHLIAAPQVRLVTFTGSVPVGKHLAQLAAREMKPTIMELGGHAPVIICEDADVETAATRIAGTKFRNAGQACLSPTRLYAHRSVYDRFVDQFAALARKIPVGPGVAATTAMGPLANARRLAAVDELVTDAVRRGGRALAGGSRIGNTGYFYAPTVLVDVPEDARILNEEPFGPVAIIARYDDEAEVLARANALPYGLAGYVFTRSAARADKLAGALECGTVGINHLVVSTVGIPFGGVKESGHGREGGVEGVEGYTVSKTVTHLLQ
ncbi:NAD-dependent succinate-semialdehyde dehydrogenase [Xanthobacter sp.]|uniref:NAD-dependent succinate-semialdehyde dehydrogenase n=1 Tax=Xanthobacter sp. TaxID=35809 RepID=UPI0035AEDD2C